MGVRGDLRGAGGPAGVHERREIGCFRQVRAGQAVGWLPGDHLVQVGDDWAVAVRVAGPAQGGRYAVRVVGPQRQDRGHARLVGDLEQPLP